MAAWLAGCKSSSAPDAPELPMCGNGIVETGEQCDDGNTADGDGCEHDCTQPTCGNHIVDRGEHCDDGNTTDGDGCEHDCTEPRCGNHIVDSTEQCDDGNFIDGDGCDHNCTVPACGNGIIDGSEQCDDGNLADADGCEHDCTIPGCGNGIVDTGEACDDGNQTNGDTCDNNCTVPACGNHMVDPGEACDDGNTTEGDACDSNCTIPACGNGIQDPSEACDDHNLVDADGCEHDCTLPACGNGIRDPGEACDDHNLVDADGCEHDCTLPVCGNHIRDQGEACDDGNATQGDTCDTNCTVPSCGNLIVDPNEQCDDGGHVDADGCEHDCTLPRCGNGIRDPGEVCDDGNTIEGDACDSNCTVPACGNGAVDPTEQCDDGNHVNGDGCDSQCRLECGNGVHGANEECDDGNRVGGDGCEPDCTLTCGHGTSPTRIAIDAPSGRCFAEYDAQHLTYQGAVRYCRGLGAHLPIATTSSENTAIEQAIATKTVWLGGSDLANRHTFEWITGVAMSFTSYGAGQPTTVAGSDCLRIAPDGTWSNAACAATSTTGTTCEFEIFEDIPHFTASAGASMTHADFNGDGRPDLVFPVRLSNNLPAIEILFGDGTGAFGAPVDVLIGTGTYNRVVVGDLNNDNKADLVFLNYQGFGPNATVSTALGHGDGTFAAPVVHAIADYPFDLALGDLDSNGRLDIVVADLGSSSLGQLQVLLATGTSGYAAPTTADVPGGAADTTTLVDLNHDGKLDVVTRSQVALGNGMGGFGTPAYFTNGPQADSLIAADLNGDGNVDLAWVFYSYDRTYVAFGDGTGGFATPTEYFVGDQPMALSVSDVDSDGDLDLVVANADEGSVDVLLNDAAGAFPTMTRYEMPVGSAASLAVLDLDGDGRVDIVSGGSPGRIVVRLDRGNGFGSDLSFGLHDPSDRSPTSPTGLCFGDFDGDGHVDIATANTSSYSHFGSTAVLRGTGMRALQPAIMSLAPAMYGLVAADFNKDGHLDIGDAWSAADLNHDGLPDLVGPTTYNSSLNVTIAQTDLRFGDGHGGFGAPAQRTFQSAPASTAIYTALATGNGAFANPTLQTVDAQGQTLVVDVDRDAFADIVVVNPQQNKLSLRRNLGNGTFGPAIDLPTAPVPIAVAAADLDEDGAIDLVVAYASNPGSLGFLMGNGMGGFTLSSATLAIDTTVNSVAAADVNRDGHVDLVYVTGQALAGLMLGTGNATFGPITRFAIGVGSKPQLVDLDENGHLDLVTPVHYGVSILLSPR